MRTYLTGNITGVSQIKCLLSILLNFYTDSTDGCDLQSHQISPSQCFNILFLVLFFHKFCLHHIISPNYLFPLSPVVPRPPLPVVGVVVELVRPSSPASTSRRGRPPSPPVALWHGVGDEPAGIGAAVQLDPHAHRAAEVWGEKQ